MVLVGDLDLCLSTAWRSVGLVDLLGATAMIRTLRQYGTSMCLAVIHSDSDGPSTKFISSCAKIMLAASSTLVSPSMVVTC